MKKRTLLLLALALVMPFTAVFAGTMYKSIGPDGSVIYSDAPPANAAPVKTLTFTPLPVTPMPDSVLRYRESLKGAANKAPATSPAATAVAANSAQIFTAPWCHVCRKAKAYLAETSVPAQYDSRPHHTCQCWPETVLGRHPHITMVLMLIAGR